MAAPAIFNDIVSSESKTKFTIFLDIDGVLNGHDRYDNGFCGIKADCVTFLNKIIDEFDVDIVVHSAWRYLVIGGSMTLEGFNNLLASHGVAVYKNRFSGRVVGITREDKSTNLQDRVDQILEYPKTTKWLAIDDLDLDLPKNIFHRTNSSTGLTEKDYQRIVAKIRKLSIKLK